MDIVALFCDLDEFFEQFIPLLEIQGLNMEMRHRAGMLALSEVMTILVLFHTSSYRNFKHYYTRHVCVHMRSEFPLLVSYNRFVELIPRALLVLVFFLMTRCKNDSDIHYIDSTPLRVCHNLRINSHRVMKGLAQRGKTSTGWFYGFKLHLVINECGDLASFSLSPGNVDDRNPVEFLTGNLSGLLFGDRGYLSAKLFQELYQRGLKLLTRLKKNMKNKLVVPVESDLLGKRMIIESVFNQLKNVEHLEHSRHRSPNNYFVDIIAGLVAYTYKDNHPSIYGHNDSTPLLENAAA